MSNNSKLFHFLKIIPIAGWIYIIVGTIWPFENQILYWAWIIDIFLSCVVHSLQLIISVPIGKALEISVFKVVVLTIIFGGTYWKPLKNSLK